VASRLNLPSLSCRQSHQRTLHAAPALSSMMLRARFFASNIKRIIQISSWWIRKSYPRPRFAFSLREWAMLWRRGLKLSRAAVHRQKMKLGIRIIDGLFLARLSMTHP
jgi:hypothetical protein